MYKSIQSIVEIIFWTYYKRLKPDILNLSVNMIYNYLKFFENVCLIYQVKREDLINAIIFQILPCK